MNYSPHMDLRLKDKISEHSTPPFESSRRDLQDERKYTSMAWHGGRASVEQCLEGVIFRCLQDVVIFPDFLESVVLWIFCRDLGSGRDCNGWEMAVGFKCKDSSLISNHMSQFLTILLILVCYHFQWSDAVSGRSQEPPRPP